MYLHRLMYPLRHILELSVKLGIPQVYPNGLSVTRASVEALPMSMDLGIAFLS